MHWVPLSWLIAPVQCSHVLVLADSELTMQAIWQMIKSILITHPQLLCELTDIQNTHKK